MAFHKARALQEAEKCLAQGKVSQAIKLYLNILENDTSDVSLYNTVGDLCIRDRNVSEGLRQFHKLAEAYVQLGFNVKAIAIYKKISKIDSNSVDVLLKLAELYQLQGLGREAREQFLSAVEFFKKRKQVEKVLEVTRKLVLLDPESTNFRNRLAAELEQAGKQEEAVVAYVESAEASLRRSDLVSADTALKKAAELNPKNSKVQLLRARVAISRHQPDDAERIIESSPGAADEPAGKQILLEAYLSAHKLPQAEKLVREVFRANPSDFTPVSGFTALCLERGEVDTSFQVLSGISEQVIQMHGAGPLIESLRQVWTKFPQHIPTLELLHQVCERVPDELTLPEVLEALGKAYVQTGDLGKAEQAFQKLSDREPENENFRGQLEDVLRKLGRSKAPARPADFAAREMALAPQPDTPQTPSPDDVDQQKMVKEALENSDLFARYNLVEKALAELEKVLQVYPDQVEIHQRILEICHKGNPERARAAAQALARISAARGDEATLQHYQAIVSGNATPADIPPPPAPPPSPPVEIAEEPAADFPVPSKPDNSSASAKVPVSGIAAAEAAEKEPAVPDEVAFDLTPLEPPSDLPAAPPTASTELDLSGEFEAMAGIVIEPAAPPVEKEAPPVEIPPAMAEAPAAPPVEESETPTEAPSREPSTVAETAAPPEEDAPFDFEEGKIEVDFYLENGFVDEARKTVTTLETKFPGNQLVAGLRKYLEERTGTAPAAVPVTGTADGASEVLPAPEPAPWEQPQPAGEDWEIATDVVGPTEPKVVEESESPTPPTEPAHAPAAEEFFMSPPVAEETVPDVDPQPANASMPVPEIAPPAVEEPAPAAGSGIDLLSDMAGEFASSLNELAVPEKPPPLSRETTGPAASPPQGVAQLSGLLAEMEDSGAASPDDPETHYNLGVAFREMGLLDEAIGEFQKVAKTAGKGHLPQHLLQACSLLAICFMEKKMPAIAVRWYLRALEIPGLEEEATMALQYDLGLAYELSGDARHALERFTEVYSQNIDFRDVAEKIRELRQKD